jgi:isohexenylglutaconyl-CoA hydratase
MSCETLIVARDGPVLKVTLNRPEVRNALSPTMVRELGEVLEAARDDAGVRVVVLTGAGGTFCAGGDLKGMEALEAASSAGAETVAASNRRFGVLLEMVDALPKTLIALIEGAAMGGGVGLIAVADWVIAEQAAQIGTPETTAGIVPAQITPFLVRCIGYPEARRLATFGLRLSAGDAQRIGLVHEVADGQEELAAKGVAAVNQCLRCAPQAVAETKRLVRASLAGWPLGPVLDEASEMFAAALAGEAREGIRAFVEKRRPAWAERIEKL